MRVISLFSGAGGFDLGFVWAGHEIVWANDNYHDAVETYAANLGKHIVECDIRDVGSEDIPAGDIVLGGFPCQGFSVANTGRSVDDSRNTLYREMVRIVRDKAPAYFLAENVKGMLSLAGGKVFEYILREFSALGYRVRHSVLDAADFGVPQHRQRLFLLGTRNGVEFEPGFPSPTHFEPGGLMAEMKCAHQWVTVGEALKGIPEPENAADIPNHTYSRYKLRFNNYLGHRRVDPGRPAPTVTSRGDSRGGVVIIHHPRNHRRMSVRELACVQSFPMEFVFHGSQTSGYRQVANAVPPLLARAIAKEFPVSLEGASVEDAEKAVSQLQVALGKFPSD